MVWLWSLEDVHFRRWWGVMIFRLDVSDGVDQDVVVQLLRIGARESRWITHESGKGNNSSCYKATAPSKSKSKGY